MSRIKILIDNKEVLAFSGEIKDNTPGDLEKSLSLLLEEASKMLRAPNVEGFPEQHLGESRETCWRCGGVGRHESTNPHIMGGPYHEHCSFCHGSGTV